MKQGAPIIQIDVEQFRRDPLGVLARSHDQHRNEVMGFTLGPHHGVLLSGPDGVRQVLFEHQEYLCKPAFLSDSNRGYWGDGLTSLEGKVWRHRRNILRECFTPAFLRIHQDILQTQTQQMLDGWRAGDVIDLRHQVRTLMAQSGARFVFDADVEGLQAPGRETIRFEEAYGEDFTAMSSTKNAPFALTRPRAPAAIASILNIIDARISHPGERHDVLSVLLQHGLEKETVVGEVIQMLFAGHHTVPHTLVNWANVLAKYPDVAQRMATADDRWASLVLKETMRVYPPAPLMYREVIKTFEMEGLRLDPKDMVWIGVHLLHRNTQFFPQPERFFPERFDDTEAGKIPPYAYLPFGGGPRQCIAHRWALTQMQVITKMIAQRMTLHPRGGHRFEVVPR